MKIKTTLFVLAFLMFLLVPTASLVASGLTTVTPFEGTSSNRDPIVAITNLVNGLLVVVGIIAAIFVVIGGMRYIFSQGDEDAQVQARNTILAAVIGIVVVILSAVVVNLVIRAARG